MKILITGAGGWLGSELTERLLEEGNYIRAFVLFSSKKLDELKIKYNDLLEIVQGDICSMESVNEALNGIEQVYHLAAKVHSLPKNKKEEEQFFKINTEASEQLFELCLEHKVKRVIFYSSVSVYGESEEFIDVNSPKNPVTPYAKSKLMAEEVGLKLFKEKGLPITIIEPVTVYGGEDVGNFEKLKNLVNKGFVPRFGNGENKKTVIYYKDLISMTMNIARDSETIGKVIICGTETISYNSIIGTLVKNTNMKVHILKLNNRFTKCVVTSFNFINLGVSKKVARQITVLASNNEYKIDNSYKYLSKITSFSDYYK
ncbi:NAD-dependent epimerase/dehydratase family protein [Clostridium cuniculi]|uniref:NAD-dependent epimerase/dehydratase family protein n=1 Tax=Clostridium cuniculi TaxID=2548455 RepID=UPI0018AA775C